MAQPDLEPSRGRVWGKVVFLALPAFLPSVISLFYLTGGGGGEEGAGAPLDLPLHRVYTWAAAISLNDH